MATREFIGFGGVPLVADLYGREDHPCVLMLPGATQTRAVWADAARELAKAGRYVVVLDLRGHGDSGWAKDGRYDLEDYIADLAAVLDQLSSRPVIVGSTLGGWIALATLGEAAAPLATALILTNPPTPLSDDNAEQLGLSLLRNIDRSGHAKKFDPKLRENAPDSRELQARLERAAETIRLPVLIVHGTHSELTSADVAASLAARLANVEIQEIAGAGHYVAFDNAEAFNAILLDFIERKVPRTPPEYVSGSDPGTLRKALGCFATGVTVVTTRNSDGQPVGLTANSFSSVSLSPPLLLVCLDKGLNSLPAFHASDSFAVNVLHIGQQPVSNLFATRVENRFASIDWETWECDVPVICDSLASFECRKQAEIDQGDHIIYVGEVIRARFDPRRDPLLYFGGSYRRLHLA